MTWIAFIVAIIGLGSVARAEESKYAIFGVVEKNDFAVRLLPDKGDTLFGYDDTQKRHAVYTTNSDAFAGLGVRYKEMKFVYSRPVSIEEMSGVGSSEGQVWRTQFFHQNHYLSLQVSSLKHFYMTEPETIGSDGVRYYPKRSGMEIQSERLRYSFSFEPGNYSLKTKFLQLEVGTDKDGATFILDFRYSKDRLNGNNTAIVPASLQTELAADADITGFSTTQISPMAGLAYMMREMTVFASLDLYAGWSLQNITLHSTVADEDKTTSGLAYSAELAGGIVLHNAYIAAMVHLDSFQIPLRVSFLELTRSYAKFELGTRF